MTNHKNAFVAAALVLPLIFSALTAQAAGVAHPKGAAAVDAARLLAADKEPGTWMSAGRTYSEQRYSPLTGISKANVGQLGLAWYGDIDTERGQESTPVVVDGVLYVTSAWSKLKAYDAATGQKLWEYDPKVDPSAGQIACCDVVNRGVAAWKGKIYLGALDGRLIALDGKTGKVAWSVQTTDLKEPYTITQVPRIVKGMVIIGNAGAEYTCRGYVSAYDAATGKLKWRFYTAPAKPGDPTNTPMLEKAAKTWSGEWWKFGGGATAWDTILYDPKTDLVYFGTGNGLSWSQEIRSPGGGDNLFVSSVIAVHASTGKYAWHFQEVPGDEWDYDVTNPLMTADLKIAGKPRHVLMQAPKTGFFYVWDAATGKLISAEKFAPANWASKIDLKTGRPVENPDVRYSETKAADLQQPGALGGHNWHPMSYSPRTGLVYIPVTESSTGFQSAKREGFTPKERVYNTGTVSFSDKITELYGKPGAPARGNIRSYLEAYDPVAQKEVWRVDDKVYGASGTMVTASDIVFRGNWSGEFVAYDAKTGKKLWSAPTQADVVAAPSTYTIGKDQYVAILVGARGLPPGQARTVAVSANNSRILVYKLNANVQLPTTPIRGSAAPRSLNPPLLTGTNEQVIDGEGAYGRFCAGCHGAGGEADKSIPDLRYSEVLGRLNGWNNIVIGGARADKGMASFSKVLAEGQSEAIYHYIVSQANKAKATQEAAAKK